MDLKDYFYAIGILATAIIGVWNRISYIRTNKRTVFINTVTSERVKWLDKLRDNISRFVGTIHTWTRELYKTPDEEAKLLGEIDRLRYLIRLQLNPVIDNGEPNTDKRIEDLIATIPGLTDKRLSAELNETLDEIIISSQELLKNEWEKVKDESQKGDLTDV